MTVLLVSSISGLFMAGVIGIYLYVTKREVFENKVSIKGSGVFNRVTLGALILAIAMFLYSDLFALSFASGAAVFLLNDLYQRNRADKRSQERMSAIAFFSQALADSIGGGKSITAAIRVASKNPPKAIEDEVKSLNVHLTTESFAYAIKKFVQALDEPAGDILGAHLLQANSYAVGKLAGSIRNISDSLQEYILTSKKVAAGRRRQVFEIKGLTIVILLLVITFFLVAPDLLSVYRKGIAGEMKLATVFALILGGWILTNKLMYTSARKKFALKIETI